MKTWLRRGGPALRPHWNRRSEDEEQALSRQFEDRRKRMN